MQTFFTILLILLGIVLMILDFLVILGIGLVAMIVSFVLALIHSDEKEAD